jgi:hypothetical protein
VCAKRGMIAFQSALFAQTRPLSINVPMPAAGTSTKSPRPKMTGTRPVIDSSQSPSSIAP